MALLSSTPNFSCSHKISFASSDTNLKKPGDPGDMASKPANAISPAGTAQGDTLVKSGERTALIPGNPEEWTQHVLSHVPPKKRTAVLAQALHTHFQKIQQVSTPFQQEWRKIIGPKAIEMSNPELVTEVTRILRTEPLSEAAEKMKKINLGIQEATLPLRHAFLKTQQDTVQKAYCDAYQITVGEIGKKAVPNLALDACQSGTCKPTVPEWYMNRENFLKNDPMDTVVLMKQNTEHNTSVLKLFQKFETDLGNLQAQFNERLKNNKVLSGLFENLAPKRL
jgi:hypothetical protein